MYAYNKEEDVDFLAEIVNGKLISSTNVYNEDTTLTGIRINFDLTLDTQIQYYSYDSLGRIIESETNRNDTVVVTTSLGYKSPQTGTGTSTTTILAHWLNTYKGTTKGFYYNYDANGNIIDVSPDDDFEDNDGVEYKYDVLNQLIRVDDAINGETWTYTYDLGGNILSKSFYAYTRGNLGTPLQTISYVYNDSEWGDLLKRYNGKNITYDSIGNMTSYGTWNYVWEHGKQLASQSNGSTTWSYDYDANGQRISRHNGTIKYSYIYDGTTIKYMEAKDILTKETICEMYFLYGQMGLVAIKCEGSLSGIYYVITNGQGDVVALLDSNRNEVVSYTYDAWGKLMSITGTLANSLGIYNPVRYRGYIYDTETQLYYLNTRYYNPDMGRYLQTSDINSMGVGLGNTTNMFVYADNNSTGSSYSNLVSGGSSVEFIISSTSSGTRLPSGVNTSNGSILGESLEGLKVGYRVIGAYNSVTNIIIHGVYYYDNTFNFAYDMTSLGVSVKSGILAFNQFDWSIGKIGAIGMVLNVGVDIYDSTQRGVSLEGVLMGAALTVVGDVALIYMNKLILYGATTAGTALFGAPGAVGGYVVGAVLCIAIDINAGKKLDEIIDKIAK